MTRHIKKFLTMVVCSNTVLPKCQLVLSLGKPSQSVKATGTNKLNMA